jgi:hypothetical protein
MNKTLIEKSYNVGIRHPWCTIESYIRHLWCAHTKKGNVLTSLEKRSSVTKNDFEKVPNKKILNSAKNKIAKKNIFKKTY